MNLGPLNLLLIGVGVAALGIVVSLVRLFLGPTAPDRVVAMDTINTLVVGGMVLLGAWHEEVIFIDIAIVYAILSFVSTLFIAHYMERGEKNEEVR